MNDETDIRQTIQVYFDRMHESSSAKAHSAFHEDAWITGYLPNGYQQMTVDDFANFVSSQQPSPKAQGVPARLDILSIDIAGQTAVARVRDDYLGMTFLDTLSLIKKDGRWSILNKLFHVEAAG